MLDLMTVQAILRYVEGLILQHRVEDALAAGTYGRGD